MEALLASVALPALVGLIKDVGGAIGRKWFGVSVDDEVKLLTAKAQHLQALATLDTPVGTPSQWVVDLRASFRYVGAAALIVLGALTVSAGFFVKDAGPGVITLGMEIIAMPFGFIFGERMTLSLGAKSKK